MKAYRIVVFALAATAVVAVMPGWKFRVAAAASPAALKLQAVEAYGKVPQPAHPYARVQHLQGVSGATK